MEFENAKPFLKWVGGKRQLLPELRSLMPEKFGSYFEPFVGGGALFFDFEKHGSARIGDTNKELIATYRTVRDLPRLVVEELEKMENTSDFFYKTRAQNWRDLKQIEVAARMIYLNKSGFNGLYRVNKKGVFNVPYGKMEGKPFFDRDVIMRASKALQGTTILCGPYNETTLHAGKGDLVYFDPPYVPISKTSNFTAYNGDGFDIHDQELLADHFDELHRRGCYLMLSNSHCEYILNRYRDYKIYVVEARRNINSNGAKRGKIKEVIVTNF